MNALVYFNERIQPFQRLAWIWIQLNKIVRENSIEVSFNNLSCWKFRWVVENVISKYAHIVWQRIGLTIFDPFIALTSFNFSFKWQHWHCIRFVWFRQKTKAIGKPFRNISCEWNCIYTFYCTSNQRIFEWTGSILFVDYNELNMSHCFLHLDLVFLLFLLLPFISSFFFRFLYFVCVLIWKYSILGARYGIQSFNHKFNCIVKSFELFVLIWRRNYSYQFRHWLNCECMSAKHIIHALKVLWLIT